MKIKRVFIFAHCDDELFCLPLLLEKNSQSTIIFLSTLKEGEISLTKSNTRQLEALRANQFLRKFADVKVLFLKGDILDGTIHDDFDATSFNQLTRIILDEKPSELVTLSYEAGHQDHDSAELITRILSENHKLKMRCFSGYRASAISPRFFLVLKPADPIGKISFNRILVTFVLWRLIIIYRSQAKTWLGLAPALILKYAFLSVREDNKSKSMNLDQIQSCFYQSRGRAIQREVLIAHQKFLQDFVQKDDNHPIPTNQESTGTE
jgi:LmbE family N-acetylglucosaminyl deacetylase